MKNPRIYNFDCSSWFWNACKVEFELKDKTTVIPAKTIVNKNNEGKIETWNILTTKIKKGPLYIVAEDTKKNDEKVMCLAYAQVKQDSIKLPGELKWDTQNPGSDGLTVFDHIIFRSQIKLI